MAADSGPTETYIRDVEGLLAETDALRSDLEQWKRDHEDLEETALHRGMEGGMPDHPAIEQHDRRLDEICLKVEGLLPRIEAALIRGASEFPFLSATLRGLRTLRINSAPRRLIYGPMAVLAGEVVISALDDFGSIHALLRDALNQLRSRTQRPTSAAGRLSRRDENILALIGESKIREMRDSELVTAQQLDLIRRKLGIHKFTREALRSSLKRIRHAKNLPSSGSLRSKTI